MMASLCTFPFQYVAISSNVFLVHRYLGFNLIIDAIVDLILEGLILEWISMCFVRIFREK